MKKNCIFCKNVIKDDEDLIIINKRLNDMEERLKSIEKLLETKKKQ